jgi:hypothetical protein
MKTKDKLKVMQNNEIVPFHICESGLYCVGGCTIPPSYFKTIDGAYSKFSKLLAKYVSRQINADN